MPMNWASRRQAIYITVAIFIFVILVGVPLYLKYFDKAPTCSDGVQNQNEHGIDCGGPCAKLCADESKDPITLYQRLFQTAPGTYSLVAMVENDNQGAYAEKADYVFKTYDKDNVLLDERTGSTFIPPSDTFPILEHSVYTGSRIPAKTVFSFIYPINWQRGSFDVPVTNVIGVSATSTDSTPKVQATLVNEEVYAITNVQVIALVYDEQNNAMAVSQTIVDSIAAKQNAKVVFTWNTPFTGSIGKIDIVARALPRNR